MGNQKLKIEFGIPSNGWLPVEIHHGDFYLAFVASRVPENPIEPLISNLIHVSAGIPSEMFWHLEPEGYWFEFSNAEKGYQIRISSAENVRAKRVAIYSVAGTDEEIILPVYRAIKKFHAAGHDDPHWPRTSDARIQKLRTTLKGVL